MRIKVPLSERPGRRKKIIVHVVEMAGRFRPMREVKILDHATIRIMHWFGDKGTAIVYGRRLSNTISRALAFKVCVQVRSHENPDTVDDEGEPVQWWTTCAPHFGPEWPVWFEHEHGQRPAWGK